MLFFGLFINSFNLNFDKSSKLNVTQEFISLIPSAYDSNSSESSGVSSRLPLWLNSLELIKDNLLFGIGTNNWGFEYPKYRNKIANDVISSNQTTRVDDPHNEYIRIISNLGLIGIIPLLLFFYAHLSSDSTLLVSLLSNIVSI